MTDQEIEHTFQYHAPDDRKLIVFDGIRERMIAMVKATAKELPPSRERSTFITLCQQAQMMANAAVAIHGHPEDAPPPKVRTPDIGEAVLIHRRNQGPPLPATVTHVHGEGCISVVALSAFQDDKAGGRHVIPFTSVTPHEGSDPHWSFPS